MPAYFQVVKDYSDREIIDCLRSRQSYVVRYLSARYLPMVRQIVTETGGTFEDARDIFQEALIILIEKIDDRDFVLTCRFKTFLYCVCKNLWKLTLTRKNVTANYFYRRVETDPEKNAEDLIDNKVYHEIFRRSFESLDKVSRDILQLYWDEVPPQEIARKLGYSYGYVRKKKCEAQAELVERVKNSPEYRVIKNSENVTRGVVY